MFVVKRFIADGNEAQIDLGFVPEYVRVHLDIDATNPDILEWSKCMEDESTAQYGILCTGSTGVLTEITAAASGIVELDEVQQMVVLPNPAGSGNDVTTVEEWAAASDYSSGYSARTASAVGSCVWPPTRNGYVYELTTATGAGTSEPSSWPTTPGATATDGGSNVWTCREATVKQVGAQGIVLGASTQTDGDVNVVMAWKADHYVNAGDAADVPANLYI